MTEKEQLWYTRFLDYASSGLPQQRWCREHNLPQSTFRYWCNKFTVAYCEDELPEPLTTDPEQWYEISCQQETAVACQEITEYHDTIRLQFGNLKMEFPSGTDSRSILQIAKGLMRP